MIKTLKIKNMALIKEISLDFSEGFNVLLGETGAGKSLILSSINFVLGEKADKSMIRTGESFMRVEASFFNYGTQTINILKDLGIEDEGVLLFVRTYNLDGKSECRINGTICPLSFIKQVASTLVDFYGQHENQVLLRAKNHLGLLESYNSSLFYDEKNKLSEILDELKKIKQEKEKIGGNFENRERMIDLLSYQINEIESAKLKENEDESLQQDLKVYANAEKISEGLTHFINSFDNSNGAIPNISSGIHTLQNLLPFDEKFANLVERLKCSLYEIQDITDEIKDICSKLVFDESKMNELDSRLDLIKSLKRKYGATIKDILEFANKSKIELENLQNAEEKINELDMKEKELEKLAFEISKKLSIKRRTLSEEIEEKICKELGQLGMKNAKFKVGFNEMPLSFNQSVTKQGFDEVEFLFSANLGENLKPLSKTISGGEMSRFMLALKNILADKDGVSTLVFDEVDAGISGIIGNAVAEKLATLSKTFQILCITHLPQVASMADNYIFISKDSVNNLTETKAEILVGDRIIEQISQLTGGANKTEASLAHARELKMNSELYKKNLIKAD